MIPVDEAKKLLSKHIPAPCPVVLPLEEAVNHVLASDIEAPMEVPSFDNSAMDGYAFAFADFQTEKPLKISYTIQAGDTRLPVLKRGEAARIFTGAPIPEGADSVVMQEKTEVNNQLLQVLDNGLKKGGNVRRKGTQTAMGEKVLKAGTRLKAGMIGLLASLGLKEVSVYTAPKIAVIVSGKELVKPGNPLQPGQIYESNSFALQAALAEMGIKSPLLSSIDDEAEETFNAIAQYLEKCELLLITGGISVGDYDYVHQALERAGVEKIFYKVKQKPGKPLYCGRKRNTLVFGLPGNPGAVLSCFYQYVKPAIRQMKGMKNTFEAEGLLKLSANVQKRQGLTHFMKGKMEGEEVTVLQGQESYKLNAFAESDCLVELEEGKEHFAKGEMVKVYPLEDGAF
ncbi:molybdopterin molybdotransferase MoeA [Nafulsella turpanensis]|uniref:molybdopterin molybdotransferase MoeA n=1 Tax=Nafulsella turpanensis TaxID=1265690 RepID=UPI000349D47D|nr:gephyrin-like molybdotransferase Glp [Nafulsella turpanensis]